MQVNHQSSIINHHEKILIVIGSISIVLGINMIIKGEAFVDQMPLFINGVILLGCSFFNKELNCKPSKESL